MSKKVLLIIAHENFQPLEYGAPKGILEQSGVEVITASDLPGTAVSSITNEQIKIDLTLEEINTADYDGVFFIGGHGAHDYLENELSYKIAREALETGKALGAICYSTRILAHAGVLENKKVTGWDRDDKLSDILEEAEAEYIRQPVVDDGKLITAVGPLAAEGWAKKILEKI
ncbi:MAG: DJ-1 family protein [Candidatus Magasanikbacteria bacterium CG10_big_fil_rev_8_21_14_0_10_36_32]|uniref:DJ-1 family protein n=1 Tax=Candidatus Magasanikbacteria bacterium CG10_big_fil_rev_8_21_14_0_10_36_32 TaxID=1974646 RepID=A0A2M6W6U8_9BACT|nr:MAG: DJ-1 family protein [Candidatus Magasanikbacteria bacterium CG10_big_fil_rev_8_21_14_0_10_36_32]